MGRPNNDIKYLAVLRAFLLREKALPSYARLGELLGFKGKAGAFRAIKRLMAAGYLEQSPGGRVVPTDRFFELPNLDDTLHAGFSESVAWSGGIESHALDRLLVDHPARTVLVPIRGDSMIEAGVFNGDTAVVERTQSAVSGDFVAALVDGQCTVKELRYERSKPVLVPHNKAYEVIRPRHELLILGVVRGIVRRYGQRRTSARKHGETT